MNSFSNGGALFFYQLIEDFPYRFRMLLFRRNKLKNSLWSGKGSVNAVFLSKCRFIVNGRGGCDVSELNHSKETGFRMDI